MINTGNSCNTNALMFSFQETTAIRNTSNFSGMEVQRLFNKNKRGVVVAETNDFGIMYHNI
jgi:hypothetical protein